MEFSILKCPWVLSFHFHMSTHQSGFYVLHSAERVLFKVWPLNCQIRWPFSHPPLSWSIDYIGLALPPSSLYTFFLWLQDTTYSHFASHLTCCSFSRLLFADLDVECKRKKTNKDDSRFHQSKWEDGVYDTEEAWEGSGFGIGRSVVPLKACSNHWYYYTGSLQCAWWRSKHFTTDDSVNPLRAVGIGSNIPIFHGR